MEDQSTKESEGRIITSVSVSPEFKEYIDQYNLSPTEVFRRGVATMLYDLGVSKFKNNMNKERSLYVKKFLENIQKVEELNNQYKKMRLFGKIKMNFDNIKKIIQDIESADVLEEEGEKSK